MLARAQLPEDVEALKDLVVEIDFKKSENEKALIQYQGEVSEHKTEILRLNSIIQLLRRQHFGPRSEKVPSTPEDQLKLGLVFNEAEALVKEEEKSEDKQTITYERGRPKRKPLPEHLPREDIVIELSPQDRQCHCGCEMQEIGEEISEKIDVIPMQIKVIRTRRKKYACKDCKENIQTAPVPPQILPKSMAAAGLLAFIIVSKFVDHLPFYRLETIFSRVGLELPRTTMARWMVDISTSLMPLINLMREVLLESHYIHSDETRVQVLDEQGKRAESLSYMWIQARAGPKPIVLYTYDPTRKAEVPKKLLDGFQGYLQVDGYGGYDDLCQKPGIIRVGCMAHARRKFFDAMKVKDRPGLSHKGLKFIQALYAVESEARDLKLSFENRFTLRLEKSKPILEAMRAWITEVMAQVPPKSTLGHALGYADRQWPHLTRYLENGELEIDNNFIENKIRPFAVGRKNWLFAQSVEGAEASATLFSLIETAKANGCDPYRYIRFLCDNIPLAKTANDYEALLPWNVNLN